MKDIIGRLTAPGWYAHMARVAWEKLNSPIPCLLHRHDWGRPERQLYIGEGRSLELHLYRCRRCPVVSLCPY
jgi:hypothetical protein